MMKVKWFVVCAILIFYKLFILKRIKCGGCLLYYTGRKSLQIFGNFFAKAIWRDDPQIYIKACTAARPGGSEVFRISLNCKSEKTVSRQQNHNQLISTA